ncbi:MAG: hypothetical protein COV52_00530 [Gammaproteobacteria bacterium CG11_big_fil_rev_8_21_14_0_20_46_22]|nr:MAG: hypothetical protein COW05_08985 [Gammaproteobacteria bacterium CG12_big_fil_rev_8_21_14_0_65_46_12]PIR12141.1 MAG: hypothetical protein COV52_00530 [Gammaproteobacteria bacterium CG11_big_fil_rev_8_21_14_0_20_46_22]
MDYLNTIKHYTQVIESGSFSGAARELDIAISKLSKEIKWLEEEKLKCSLIFRTTRRLEPTPEGLVFYEEAKRILASVKQAELRLLENQGELQGPIRLSLSNLYSKSPLLDVITAFLEQHPKIELETLNGNNPYAAIEGQADLAISSHLIEHPRLLRKPIMTLRRAVLASPAYIARHGSPDSLDTLKDYNCLVNTQATPDSLWHFSGKRQIKVRGSLKTASTTELLAAASRGLGILYLPEQMLLDEIEQGLLVKLPLDKAPVTSHSHLYYEPHAEHALITQFAEYLLFNMAEYR